MKIIVQLLLFFFISFLITPTIISVIKKDGDISAFYNFSEEENSQKEIKAIIHLDLVDVPIDLTPLNCRLIFSEILSKHNKFSSKIFTLPPEKV